MISILSELNDLFFTLCMIVFYQESLLMECFRLLKAC